MQREAELLSAFATECFISPAIRDAPRSLPFPLRYASPSEKRGRGMADDEDGMDPYAVLGVARDCTTEQVRRAYRQLASACHPDKHPGEGEDQVRLREEGLQRDAE